MKFKDQKGIALMLALGTVMVLTTLAIEFAYNSHVSYSMALNERDRLRAYYLARSALQLAKLEMGMEKEIRGKFASQLQQAGVPSQPICQQFPFSTAILRGLVATEEGGPALPGRPGEGEGQEKKEPEKTPEEEKKGEVDLSFLREEQAKDFLDFEGDFSVHCEAEESKLNLNFFRTAGSDPYEEQKQTLETLFLEKRFEPVFEKKREQIKKVVQNIADWVDRNDRINEAPGIEGGYEDSLYVGSEYTYKVKNGKMASLAELLLVSGVGDDLFNLAGPSLTVYGGNKINICIADDAIIKAVVLKYVNSQQGVAPIRPDDEEALAKVLDAIHQSCLLTQEPNAIAGAINKALGITTAGSSPIQSLFTTETRFYSFDLTGQSGDIELKVRVVLDAKGNSNEWKMLYYRVQ
ncbi:MAG: type II secretion system protein GspK [Deltaproteobacteria bacterium]|nr:type II secretion system protein GspK [Deltaproteobacteria bacterium]